MKKPISAALSAMAIALAGCGSVSIEGLAGCYEIDDAPVFQLRNDYAVFVDGRQVGQMRMSDTDQGPRYEVSPGLLAVPGEDGYSVRLDGGTPQAAGFIEKTLFGSVYMLIPTGEADPEDVRAYLVEGGDC